MNIKAEGHAIGLAYGWWKEQHGELKLPRTFGHTSNFVLMPDEVAAYDLAVVTLKEFVDREALRSGTTCRAYNQSYISKMSGSENHIHCFTLADVLNFQLRIMEQKLAMMKLLIHTCTRAKEDTHERSCSETPDQCTGVTNS